MRGQVEEEQFLDLIPSPLPSPRRGEGDDWKNEGMSVLSLYDVSFNGDLPDLEHTF